MKTITTIGIDLAKNSFSCYGVDAKGKSVLQRVPARVGAVRFFTNPPACLVGMEACAPSEYRPEPLRAPVVPCAGFILAM